MPVSGRIGKRSIVFDTKPAVLGYAAVVGKKEGEGPLKDRFDRILEDPYNGEESWEKAESSLIHGSFTLACSKAKLSPSALDAVYAGDLLHHGGGAAARGHVRGRWLRRERLRRDRQPFLQRGAAIPLPAGIRRAAHAQLAMDRDRSGRGDPRKRRKRRAHILRDSRQDR